MTDASQLKELYLTRQSCRSFCDKPISKKQIEEICALAGLAPSSCNLQPWKIYAVTGEKLAAVKTLLKNRGKAPFVDGVPAILVIAEDTSAAKAFNPALPYFAPYDVGEFTSHLVLAAAAAGLASCILGWRDGATLKEVLSLPEKLSVPYVVALGYAADGYETRPKKRKPLEEILEFID
mgnify:CR=1 FL=1